MATDIVYTTVNLPPAFIGVAYEAGISYKGNQFPASAQSITVGNLPAGLAIDTFSAAPGSLRISGTPTGAANATPQSGAGAYAFTVSMADSTDTAVTKALTLNLYNSPQDLIVEGQRGPQDGLN